MRQWASRVLLHGVRSVRWVLDAGVLAGIGGEQLEREEYEQYV